MIQLGLKTCSKNIYKLRKTFQTLKKIEKKNSGQFAVLNR